MFNEQFINDNVWLLLIIVLTDYVLKAIALWIAARKNSKVWFVLLLLLNTAGILPFFYIFYFSKKDFSGNHSSADHQSDLGSVNK
ncbi:hypothetical protein KC947_00670 [Candidatus Saccharibacteria bacterium]|nr:hypothetical protein [Candidatus Saccharibacteria bacterium]